MQYNSHATGQDIVTMADTLAKSNSNSFPLATKTLFANEALRMIWSWIYQVYGGWIYDDSNQTGLPELTATLTADQQFYSLPTGSGPLFRVAYKDSAGVWTDLRPLALENIPETESEFENVSSSAPIYYRPVANGFKIYPASDTTRASALRIWIKRDGVSFASTDTTAVPGFDQMYHEAVPTYMALQYARVNQLAVKNDLETQWLRYEDRIKKDYSQRFRELFPARFKTRDIVQEYI